MQTILILLILLAKQNVREQPICVDLIEHNIVERTPELRQFIFWRWSPDYRRYDCQGWIIEKDSITVSKIDGVYSLDYFKNGNIIRITSKVFRRTWTKTDPERDNTRLFPETFRRLMKE